MDTMNSWLINPVWGSVKYISGGLGGGAKLLYNILPPSPRSTPAVQTLSKHCSKEGLKYCLKSGRNYIRLAGVSGSIAVCLGAYGAHTLLQKKEMNMKK